MRKAPLLIFPTWTSLDRSARYAGDAAPAFAENERSDSLSMQHDVGDDFEGDDSKGC